MKNIIFILAFTVSFVSNTQEAVEKTIGEFTTVKVYDLIHLKMIKSDENKIVVTGKNKEDIKVYTNVINLKRFTYVLSYHLEHDFHPRVLDYHK